MDTKLKNNHKFAGILIVVFLLICSIGMTASYPMYKNRISEAGDRAELEDAIENIWDNLVPGIHFLYNEVYQETDQSYDASRRRNTAISLDRTISFWNCRITAYRRSGRSTRA